MPASAMVISQRSDVILMLLFNLKRTEISSYKLCRIIASLYNWNLSKSYRVPGQVFAEKRIAIFDLKRAEIIDRFEIE